MLELNQLGMGACTYELQTGDVRCVLVDANPRWEV